MSTRSSRLLPIILGIIILGIIVYLFMTVEQKIVTCSNTYTSNDIKITEKVEATIDGNKITHMNVSKTIILPDRFVSEENINGVKSSLEKSLEYLGHDYYVITTGINKVVVDIDLDNNKTIILNNISFVDGKDLVMKINPNTKSSEVITLKVGDNYTEGEFMKHLKNNGYTCR